MDNVSFLHSDECLILPWTILLLHYIREVKSFNTRSKPFWPGVLAYGECYCSRTGFFSQFAKLDGKPLDLNDWYYVHHKCIGFDEKMNAC